MNELNSFGLWLLAGVFIIFHAVYQSITFLRKKGWIKGRHWKLGGWKKKE